MSTAECFSAESGSSRREIVDHGPRATKLVIGNAVELYFMREKVKY